MKKHIFREQGRVERNKAGKRKREGETKTEDTLKKLRRKKDNSKKENTQNPETKYLGAKHRRKKNPTTR